MLRISLLSTCWGTVESILCKNQKQTKQSCHFPPYLADMHIEVCEFFSALPALSLLRVLASVVAVQGVSGLKPKRFTLKKKENPKSVNKQPKNMKKSHKEKCLTRTYKKSYDMNFIFCI